MQLRRQCDQWKMILILMQVIFHEVNWHIISVYVHYFVLIILKILVCCPFEVE